MTTRSVVREPRARPMTPRLPARQWARKWSVTPATAPQKSLLWGRRTLVSGALATTKWGQACLLGHVWLGFPISNGAAAVVPPIGMEIPFSLDLPMFSSATFIPVIRATISTTTTPVRPTGAVPANRIQHHHRDAQHSTWLVCRDLCCAPRLIEGALI